MPDGNGWDLLSHVDAHLPLPTYAVAMSAWTGKDVQAISEAVGFHYHLDKPIEPLALDRVLNQAAEALADFSRNMVMPLHRRH